MFKWNRPPSREESIAHARESIKSLRNVQVWHAATILLDSGLVLDKVSADHEQVDFHFPGAAVTKSGQRPVGISLSGQGKELTANVYVVYSDDGRQFHAQFGSEAERWIGDPDLVKVESSAGKLIIGKGAEQLVINPHDHWHASIQTKR